MKIRITEMLKGVEHTMSIKETESRVNVKEYLTIRKRGQITLPKPVIEKLDLNEGDQLELEVTERGEMRLVPIISIPKDQAWFWKEEWQRNEREADEDIKANRVKSFEDVDEAIHWLESDDAEKWANEE